MRLGRPKITCFEYCEGDKKGITLQPKPKSFSNSPRGDEDDEEKGKIIKDKYEKDITLMYVDDRTCI